MSFENVILSYPHPHTAVYVEDNTGYTETFLSADEPITLIQCGAFASGRDNQLLYCETLDEFLNEFSNPNYKLYGQAGYNVSEALKTQYAAAYVMRVMPEDATYSNLVVSATYKVETLTDEETMETSKKLTINYGLSTINGATTKEELDDAVATLRINGLNPNEDGSYTSPLFCIYQSGRGSYGNATRIRFADVTEYDNPDNTYKCARLDVLQMGKTLNRIEYCFGSFNPDLYDTDSSESLYLEDLVNDPENGLVKVNISVVEATVTSIIKAYNDNCLEEGEDELTSSTFDLLFGKNMDGTTNTKMEIISVLDDTEGVSLNGGSDGSFEVGGTNENGEPIDRDDVISQCLIKAYSGQYDKRIKSRYSAPADYILDANFDIDVKKSMVALALKRKWDGMTYIDSGTIGTTDELITWLESMTDYYGNNVIKECGTCKIRDTEYTGKTIPVTMTYFLASKIPTHFSTRGLNIPMTLEDFRITKAVKGTFLPSIDPDEDDLKKVIYNLRGNVFETVKYGTYQRAWAITSQKETSDRLDEFNEYILQLGVQIATDEIRSKIYKFAEPDDRKTYKRLADQRLQFELGPLVRSVSVDFTMSATDERKNIMRIVLRIVYKTVVKRGIVEIYLDPRA